MSFQLRLVAGPIRPALRWTRCLGACLHHTPQRALHFALRSLIDRQAYWTLNEVSREMEDPYCFGAPSFGPIRSGFLWAL